MTQIRGLLFWVALVGGAWLGAGAQQIDYNTQIKNKPSAIGFPAASDHIQFVSPNGNDANDGLSWASAKLTCAAAIAALGGSNAIIYQSPALAGSDCIAATGSATGLNGYIWSPSRFYIGPSAQASAGTTGADSKRLRFAGSVWNGNAAVDDFWDFYVNSFPGAFFSGSNFIISHSSVENGAGRILALDDFVVGQPRDADPAHNSNSFAFDNQGGYYENGSQNMLWEMANTVDHDGALPVTFRQNFVPIFGSACSGCSAEIAFGGSGTLGVSGNYSGAPKWLWSNLNGNFNTATWVHNFTAPHTITAVDADSNTIRPLGSPGSDHKWVQYVDNSGVQNRTQPAFADISGSALATQVTAAGSAGQIQFNNTTLAADSNLFWDNTNKRLGIGQATPTVPFHIKTTATGGAMHVAIENGAAGGSTWYIGSTDNGNGAGGGRFVINNSTSTGTAALTIDSSGNLGVNQTSPAAKLDVNGGSKFTGTINANSSAINNAVLNGAGNGNSVTLLNEQNVSSTLTGNGSDQTLFTYSLPANTLGAGKGIRVRVWLSHSSGTANVNYKVSFGATAYANDTTSGAGRGYWEVAIFNNPGVQNAQHGVNTIGLPGTGFGTNVGFFTITSAENTAGTVTIKATFNAANTEQVTIGEWIVELIQ